MRRTLVACVITALVLGGGTATAASLMTGANIKNGSLTGQDIKNGSLAAGDLSQSLRNRLNRTVSGSPGAPGSQGAKGDTGAAGPQGLKGDTGAPGADGVNGAKGDKGDTGSAGPAGADGAMGPAGTAGAKGDKGDKGDNGDDGADGATGGAGPQGPAGILSPLTDSLATPMAIATIGGPINTGNTNLDTGLTLPAGKYVVTVDAAFESNQAGNPAVEVYPQVSLWIDRDDNGEFTWQTGEGDISPNAIMPVAANRHISASGITQVTLTEETYVGLVAHGYTSTQGSERSGEIKVVRAVIGALPVN